jgi:nitrite reductase/ring-hydroxylating ferredoxin subunit
MADAAAVIALCPSAALVERGDGLRFEVLADGRPAGAFVVRFRGRVHGYLNRCAHLALELDWQPGRFFDSDGETLLCSTHGAAYGPLDGQCVGGTCAGRGGLRRLQVFEDGGVVYWRPDGSFLPGPGPRAG